LTYRLVRLPHSSRLPDPHRPKPRPITCHRDPLQPEKSAYRPPAQPFNYLTFWENV